MNLEIKSRPLEEITLQSDTTVHIEGVPFTLRAGTVILGRRENFAEALSAGAQSRRISLEQAERREAAK